MMDLEKAVGGAEGESVRQKIADLMEYAGPVFERFPKPEKGYAGLATRTRLAFFSMAEREMDAHRCRQPRAVMKELEELDRQVQYAKFYVETAFKWRCIDEKKHRIMEDYLSQIGKMVGSWMKKVAATIKEQGSNARQ